MSEELTYSLAAGLGITLVATPAIAFIRSQGWIGPLLDAETRRPLVLRVLALAIWIFGVTFAAIALTDFLSSQMGWLATALGWASGVALTALGVGVALL